MAKGDCGGRATVPGDDGEGGAALALRHPCNSVFMHLRPGLSLLDVGRGPGTITVDLARLVAPGPVVGLNASPEVVAQAESLATPGSVVLSVK